MLPPTPTWIPPPTPLTAFSDGALTETCVGHLHDLFTVLSERYEFDPSGCTIRHQEVVDGFTILDDADWWANVRPVLGQLVPWNSLNPAPDETMPDKEDWFRQPVDMTDPEAFPCQQPDGPSVIFYHGTISECVDRIVKCGAFIPGENGHTKGKRHFKGCFGSMEFSVASFRGDPTRGLSLEPDSIYTFSCCPAVLELQASYARLRNYKRKRPGLLVIPGTPGSFLPGLRLRAIHWNRRFVVNYVRLHDPEIRRQITQLGGVFEVCCGGQRQATDFQSCGAWSPCPWNDPEFLKLGKSYVCKRCHARWQ